MKALPQSSTHITKPQTWPTDSYGEPDCPLDSFWPWALSDSNGYIRSLMSGWWCHGWLAAQKYARKVEKERGQGKTEKTYIPVLWTGQKKLIECVAPLSQHPSCTVSKTSGCFAYCGHALHNATLFLVVGFCSLFFSFFFNSTRTLIKIHQKKYFQQQCLKMLPPPISSIKSGSSNLKGDEKLSLTLCHTPVKRQAHSKQRRVQVLIYYSTQIIFLPFFLTMGMFTSQMELSVVLWAFADLKFCFPWWKSQGKKKIGSLPTEEAFVFVSNNGRCLGIISMAMNVQIISQRYQVKKKHLYSSMPIFTHCKDIIFI